MTIKSTQVRKLRTLTNKTQTEAAKDVHVTLRCWQGWEAPEGTTAHRKMPEGYVELFCIKNKIPYPVKIR